MNTVGRVGECDRCGAEEPAKKVGYVEYDYLCDDCRRECLFNGFEGGGIGEETEAKPGDSA